MRSILSLAPCDDDDSRQSIHTVLCRDDRAPVRPARDALWDCALIALGVACNAVLLWAQFA